MKQLLSALTLAVALALPGLAQEQPAPDRPPAQGARPGAAPVEDAFLDRFVGVWEGEGQIEGQEALEFSSWEWVLGHQFLSVTYMATRLSAELESSTYEGYGYFRPAEGGGYRATWLDSLGVMAPMTARRDGEALIVEWEPRPQGPARVVYRFTGPDRLEATYYRRKGEQLEEIGKTTLVRGKD